MRVAFVLGALNLIAARQLASLKADCIYHFSANEFASSDFSMPSYRLKSPQRNAFEESAIVENAIERTIVYVSKSGGDSALMRRALRLSELRVEARCYLNAVEYIQQHLIPSGRTIGSVIFVSHYLQSTDVSSFPSLRVYWHQSPHSRFLGLVPGLSRLFFLLRVVFGRSGSRQGKPVQ